MQNPQGPLSGNGGGHNDASDIMEVRLEAKITPEDPMTQGKEVAVRSSSQLWQHQGAIWRTSYQLQATAEAEAQIADQSQCTLTQVEVSRSEASDVTVETAETTKHGAIQPVSAAALLVADVAARLFCLTIFWVVLVFAIICSNAAVCAVLLHRARLSLETALGLLVALDLALAVLCIIFVARRVNTDTFTWLTSSLFRRPTLVNVEARASLMDRLENVEAQLQPVMQKAMKAFDKAEDKLRKRAAEAVLLMREDTPASEGTPTALRAQGHGKASRQQGIKPQGMARYMREARKVAKVFGKMAKGKAHTSTTSGTGTSGNDQEKSIPRLGTGFHQVTTDAAPV